MATENKSVMCYLPEDIERYIIQYCTEYNITRKDKEGNIKPALGTAVVDILKRFFISEVPTLDPGEVVSRSEFEEAITTLQEKFEQMEEKYAA